MKRGAFTFVLHSHLPYCRRAGRWPHGEEWLHEAIAETYLPLLSALYDLRDDGVPFRLTIGITPVLTEQLADDLVLEHFREYARERIERADKDVARLAKAGDAQQVRPGGLLPRLVSGQPGCPGHQRFGNDIVGAFRQLSDEGYLEIVTCAATHGYLPLFSRDSTIHAQIAAGAAAHQRHYGRAPRSIWLPECAYRPAYLGRRGCAEAGNRGVPGRGGARPLLRRDSRRRGRDTRGQGHRRRGRTLRRHPAALRGPHSGLRRADQPHHRSAVLGGGAEVAVIGRNNRTGMQVWSADWGYPGDGAYREFHKKDGVSGLQYWRVTGPKLDLAQKGLYDPAGRTGPRREHARHFAGLVEEVVAG